MAKARKRDEALYSTLALLMLAHLSIVADAQPELARYNLSRTDHRILFMVLHSPGVTVGRVVQVLRLTAQAVQGPMRRLLDLGFIEQRAIPDDLRKRHLYATSTGETLLRSLSERQFGRIARAFDAMPPGAADQFRAMLLRLTDPEDLAWLNRADDPSARPSPRTTRATTASAVAAGERRPSALPTCDGRALADGEAPPTRPARRGQEGTKPAAIGTPQGRTRRATI